MKKIISILVLVICTMCTAKGQTEKRQKADSVMYRQNKNDMRNDRTDTISKPSRYPADTARNGNYPPHKTTGNGNQERSGILFNSLFFFLDKKETKNQESITAYTRATRHRMLSRLTRGSEISI